MERYHALNNGEIPRISGERPRISGELALICSLLFSVLTKLLSMSKRSVTRMQIYKLGKGKRRKRGNEGKGGKRSK